VVGRESTEARGIGHVGAIGGQRGDVHIVAESVVGAGGGGHARTVQAHAPDDDGTAGGVEGYAVGDGGAALVVAEQAAVDEAPIGSELGHEGVLAATHRAPQGARRDREGRAVGVDVANNVGVPGVVNGDACARVVAAEQRAVDQAAPVGGELEREGVAVGVGCAPHDPRRGREISTPLLISHPRHVDIALAIQRDATIAIARRRRAAEDGAQEKARAVGRELGHEEIGGAVGDVGAGRRREARCLRFTRDDDITPRVEGNRDATTTTLRAAEECAGKERPSVRRKHADESSDIPRGDRVLEGVRGWGRESRRLSFTSEVEPTVMIDGMGEAVSTDAIIARDQRRVHHQRKTTVVGAQHQAQPSLPVRDVARLDRVPRPLHHLVGHRSPLSQRHTSASVAQHQLTGSVQPCRKGARAPCVNPLGRYLQPHAGRVDAWTQHHVVLRATARAVEHHIDPGRTP